MYPKNADAFLKAAAKLSPDEQLRMLEDAEIDHLNVALKRARHPVHDAARQTMREAAEKVTRRMIEGDQL